MTPGRRLRDLALGLTPRVVMEKLGAMQILDVHLSTTDGRQVILTRYTQPEFISHSCAVSHLASPSESDGIEALKRGLP